jgi:catechol 2,3-dioxygenase-like lactoylglutathione lyase family enzyme
MLADTNAVATIPVKKLDTARRFYEGILGLKVEDERPGVLTLDSGNSRVFVYESDYAGTNRATAATWTVGDEVDSIVKTLKGKGVSFEHYDMPGMKLQGDVHVGDGMKVAWCKDPDGNILSFVSG